MNFEITTGKIPSAVKVVLYGPEGIGKSTLASQFPNPLYIDTEGSTKHMNVRRLPTPQTWEDLMQEIQYVIAHPEVCRTLVIDTADWAEKLIKDGVTILDEPYLMTRGRNDRSRIWFIPEELYSMDLKGLETTYAGVLSRLPEGSLTADQAAQKRVAEYQIARARRIQETVRTIGADDIQVAVAHYPLTESLTETLIGWKETTETFSLRRVSLIMAGHYCAGQWRIPGAGALYVPELGWFPDDELIVGRHYIGRIPQYISPGLGASGSYPYMPFRLFNNPSVSSLELTQKLVQ